MKQTHTLLVAAIAATTLTPLAAFAQESSPAVSVQQDIHARLYEVIISAVELDVSVRQLTVSTVDAMLVEDPLLAEVAAEEPDFRKDMVNAFFPYLLQMSERVQILYRPVFIDTLREQLSDREAEMMADVFGSPVGRKLMGGVARNTTAERSSQEALDGEEISREAISADNRETAERSVSELTEDDFLELARFVEIYPELLATFQRLNPHLLDIRVAMDNELPTAEEERMFLDTISRVYSKYDLELLPE